MTQNINISLDASIKSIDYSAACHLSSIIANGILFSQNNSLTIYSDRIDFGQCHNTELQDVYGSFYGNFYMELGRVIYRYGSNLKCGWFRKKLEYVGFSPPNSPDDREMFNLIYPRFK